MKVPFSILDFLNRAESVDGDRVGVSGEPDQPTDSGDQLTWRQAVERGRVMAAGIDTLGIDPGERIAIVSHNSAFLVDAVQRMPTSRWKKVPGSPHDRHTASKCRGRASSTIAS